MLFPDVANCMQTDDLELKKLVYLYLTTYARSAPDLAIMAVNTFVKDAADPNPLVRALAIRTMGCIRVDRIVEYLCDPLGRALKVTRRERERERERERGKWIGDRGGERRDAWERNFTPTHFFPFGVGR